MREELLQERKKAIYGLICDELYVPMKAKEIAAVLNVPKSDRRDLAEVLDALVAEGKVEVSSKGKYMKSEGKFLTGVFAAHPRGFGFVTVEGEDEDIFIPESQVNGAFHGDTVQVALTRAEGHGRRREGQITKILTRGVSRIVCTYEKSKTFGFAVPDNPRFGQDIFIPQERSKGAVSGHKVVVELTDFGGNGKKPEGKVVEILGHVNDPGTDILSIVRGYDLPTEFSEKIMNQVERVAGEVSTADMAGRMDLRDWQTVTIDGEDAKDLDDAITLTKEGDVYRLGVHIADVTNYVQERSALDVEALKRGTSVYLVDRVIPMLPHQLSNGICSLNQGCDRLALSCIMEVDPSGKVVDHQIAETLINVDHRMTYTSVAKILDGDMEERNKYEDFVEMFELMKELSDILRHRRHERGSIDFDFPEFKIILDEKGRPVDVYPHVRNAATKIIEDFMLCANETIAEEFYWREIPFLYRIHEIPDHEKIDKLQVFLQNFGIYLKSSHDEIHPKEVQKLLTKIEGTPEEPLISRLTLRSMKQAKYSAYSSMHFGLSTKYYCHFTSPIRRYPDLQIHRIIKETLHNKFTTRRFSHYDAILPKVAEQSSKMERRAEEVEREVCKLKKAEYMRRRIGEVHEGIISGVTNWGIYVELPNTIEGMVHVSILPGDYYYYDEKTYSMVGERTGRTFKLGEKAKIRVKDVDMMLKNIDFDLVEDDDYEQSEDGWN